MIRTLLFCLALILSPALVRGDELTKLDLDRLFSDLYLKEGEKRAEAGELPQGRFFDLLFKPSFLWAVIPPLLFSRGPP